MIKNKNYKLIHLKYFFYFIICIFYICIKNIVYAEKNYNFNLLSRNDLLSPKINDLKQFLINEINQKRILVDDKDKAFFLKNISLAKIIDKSSNFPSDTSFFIPDNKYYFVLEFPTLVKTNDNLSQKYKFSFIYENRFSKILKKTELGTLDELNSQTIINKIKNLNPILNQNNLQVEKIISNKEAIIFSQEFEGKVSVTYNIKQNIPQTPKLKDFLKKTELGTFDDFNIQTIINKIKNLNPILNKKELRFDEIPNLKEAIIASKDFEGKVLVTYNIEKNPSQIISQIPQQIFQLRDVLQITKLGILDEINNQIIIAKIKNLNPILDKNDLQVDGILNPEGTIIVSKEFEGKVSVTFDILEQKNKNNSGNYIIFIIVFLFLFILLLLIYLL